MPPRRPRGTTSGRRPTPYQAYAGCCAAFPDTATEPGTWTGPADRPWPGIEDPAMNLRENVRSPGPRLGHHLRRPWPPKE
jgi:hypothetical protein